MASSAFGIGCAIGLVLNLGLLPTLDRHSSAQAAALPSATMRTLDPDPELQGWIDGQQAISDVVFGTGVEANACYKVNSAITTWGTFSGENQFGTAFSLNVAFAKQVDISSMTEAWVSARHLSAYHILARMTGPAGNVPIAGTVISIDNDYLGRVNQLWIGSTLSESDYAPIVQCSDVYRGPLVVDATANTVTPLEEVNGEIPAATVVTDSPALIMADSNATPAETQAECIKRAQQKLKTATDNALSDLATCCEIATIGLLAATGLCLAISLSPWPGIAQFIGGACMIRAMIAYAATMAGCALVCANKLAQAAQTYAADMAACGVIIVNP